MKKDSIVIRINKKPSQSGLDLDCRKQIIYLEAGQLAFVAMKAFHQESVRRWEGAERRRNVSSWQLRH